MNHDSFVADDRTAIALYKVPKRQGAKGRPVLP